VLTEQEAKNWPRRNVLTRAIGVAEDVDTDIADGDLRDGDIFILCSDGLTTHVEAREMAELVIGCDPQIGCQSLIDLALTRGGRDNVTVIVLNYRRRPSSDRDGPTLFRPGPIVW
jgi:serine/threonine protein phosphatase PrpC